MVLEALCGADIDEIEMDYMTTYENYYAITKESDEKKYSVIRDDLMIPMVRTFVNDENADLKKTDLSAFAEKYLLDSGLSKEEIDLIKNRLTGEGQASPLTPLKTARIPIPCRKPMQSWKGRAIPIRSEDGGVAAENKELKDRKKEEIVENVSALLKEGAEMGIDAEEICREALSG